VRRAKVADYILDRDRENLRTGNPNNEPVWETWLQDNRIERDDFSTKSRVGRTEVRPT
jgi:hypothetical protein